MPIMPIMTNMPHTARKESSKSSEGYTRRHTSDQTHGHARVGRYLGMYVAALLDSTVYFVRLWYIVWYSILPEGGEYAVNR
jgi:hypothetical protein